MKGWLYVIIAVCFFAFLPVGAALVSASMIIPILYWMQTPHYAVWKKAHDEKKRRLRDVYEEERARAYAREEVAERFATSW